MAKSYCIRCQRNAVMWSRAHIQECLNHLSERLPAIRPGRSGSILE